MRRVSAVPLAAIPSAVGASERDLVARAHRNISVVRCAAALITGPVLGFADAGASPPHPQEPPCGRLPPPSVVADSPPEDTGTALVGASVLACLLGECGPRSRRCS